MEQAGQTTRQFRRRCGAVSGSQATALLLVVIGGVAVWWAGSQNRDERPHSARTDPVNVSASADHRSPTSGVKSNRATVPIDRQSVPELDPTIGGWDAEVFHDAADRQLKSLGRLIANLAQVNDASTAKLVAPNFACNTLRPASLAVVYRDELLQVQRASTLDAADMSPADDTRDSLTGAAGLARGLRDGFAPFMSASDVRFKFKTLDVQVANDEIMTRQLIEVSGRSEGGMVEQHAKWIMRWSRSADGPPLIRSIRVVDLEETTLTKSAGPLFRDCTEAALSGNDCFQSQLMYGVDHWLRSVDLTLGMGNMVRYGMAVGDVNGDLLDDLYLCQPGGLPNRLFLQTAAGTLRDVSADAGVDWLDATTSALMLDLDNDGDQDLAVATADGVLIMANNDMHFSLAATLQVRDRDVQSLSAADYDSDGDLDLYMCIDFADQSTDSGSHTERSIYYDATDGGRNSLFRNDTASGGWKFTDATAEAGLDTDNHRHSLAASWEDFDNDGDPDLYVANDYGPNCLYRNDGGQFVNIAATAGVEDYGSGMSVSWGDFNRDGRMDLYVGNMFSAAGSRITSQARFRSDAPQEIRRLYKRFAKGNTLFQNAGGEKFNDVGAQSAVEMGRWAWGSVFADFNNDGWEDIIVANGYISAESENTNDL